MDYYLAPLEGITTYIYRNAYHKYFYPADKYFMPFITPNQKGKFAAKEMRELIPEHNAGKVVIPQILTNKSVDFIETSKKLKEWGYKEINLNLGCPSGTVVAKGKGSGFLADPIALNRFLEEIFMAGITDISIKTRLGKDEADEFETLMKIYNKYPLKELIIHPRVQKDYYKGTPDLETFKSALDKSKSPVCYNGDICCVEDLHHIQTTFKELDTVMIGRGILMDPGLLGKFHEDSSCDKEKLKGFHDEVLYGYQKILSGDKTVLFKMKELWYYMISMFEDSKKYGKKIKKTEKLAEYEKIVAQLFSDCRIII